MNRWIKGTAAATVCVIVVASFWSDRLDAVPRAGSKDYVTSDIEVGIIKNTITATGSLKAVSTVEVSTQLSGQIARLHADFNDSVVSGQVLAVLDQRGFHAHVQQMRAELQMAHDNVAILAARLEKVRGEDAEAQARRNVFRAGIDKARANLPTAERRLKRFEALGKRGTSSDSSIDDAHNAYDTAAAELREATALGEAHGHAIAASRAGLVEAEAELVNARAAVPFREATLALAELDLDRSAIRAPVDGVVVARNVEQGQTVAASFDAPTLFTIAGDLAEMEIHAHIDETDIGKIKRGQSATFGVDAYPGRTFEGMVSEVRLSAQSVQGVVMYTVVLKASNPERLLFPAMTATVRIALDVVGPVKLLAIAALYFSPQQEATYEPNIETRERAGNDGSIVWVLDRHDDPKPRRIRLGADNGHDIAVLAGDLEEGERIITGRGRAQRNRRLFGIRF